MKRLLRKRGWRAAVMLLLYLAGLAVGGYRGERLRQADPLVAFGALGRRRLPTAGRIGALGFVCCVFGHRMST